MKKVMFNDPCGLTDAVLQGRKTMTRRIVRDMDKLKPSDAEKLKDHPWLLCKSPYQIGDEVAVSQNYRQVFVDMKDADLKTDFMKTLTDRYWPAHSYEEISAWKNKMFVAADLMPHRLRITAIKVERLQDISDDDCMKEGIEYRRFPESLPGFVDLYGFPAGPDFMGYPTAREAFAILINRTCGKGTWERNPYVYAYTFELIK